MPKQFFNNTFGDNGFKTIITKDSKGSETGHISSSIVEDITIQADDGSYVESNSSNGIITISSDTRWADETDGEKIKFFKDKNNLTVNGLAFVNGGGIYTKTSEGFNKPIAPGLISSGSGLPDNAERGTFYLNDSNQLFLNAGPGYWLRLGTSIVSNSNPNLWTESGAHMTSVADLNNYYAGSNVEDILAELGERLPLYFTARPIEEGDDTFSYGHLVEKPANSGWDTFNWMKYNDNIDEIYNPNNGNYYINRKDMGVSIAAGEIINDDYVDDIVERQYDKYQDENSNNWEKTLYIKHKGEKIQLATKRYAHFLFSKMPKSKLAVDITEPEDIWTEFSKFDQGKEPVWYDALDAGNGDLRNPIKADGSIDMGDTPVLIQQNYNLHPRKLNDLAPENYVFKNKNKDATLEYISLNPRKDNPKKGLNNKPSINEAIRRYVMDNPYYTNCDFNMDLQPSSNQNGLNLFYGIKDKSGWTIDAYNIASINDSNIKFGESNHKLTTIDMFADSINVDASRVDFKGSNVIIGSQKGGKLTINQDLEMTGQMTQNSDLYFHLYGAGAMGDPDKSIVNIGFDSDDSQVNAALTADARNTYKEKDTGKEVEYQANLWLADDMSWYKYNSIGRFGLRDGNSKDWIILRESTYDFTEDLNGDYNGIAKKIKLLDKQIRELKKQHKENSQQYKDLVSQRNTQLRAQQRSLMTTVGGKGQTMIKSNNSRVVLRSDLESGQKIVASAPGHDIFTVRAGGRGTTLVLGAHDNITDVASNGYPKARKINFVDSRGSKADSNDRMALGLIGQTVVINPKEGVFHVSRGQTWTNNFLAIGADPKQTTWKDATKDGGKSHTKNYGNATENGHLRIYSCTHPTGNKDQVNALINNYYRIDFDINTRRLNIKYVDERLGEYAKTYGGDIDLDHLFADRITIKKGGLDDKKDVNLIDYIKNLEARIKKLEK